jgi:antitoxin VapB
MKTAKLFKNGQSQAVRLPKEYRFEGDEVFIKKVGSSVVLLPEKNSWDALVDSLGRFTPEFMAARAQPRKKDKRESWD